MLFIIHLLLFLTLPSYRANLWLALLCLAWALKTGVIGTKLWLTLLPWLTWETVFRLEYLSFPVSLLLLSLTYRELFPGTLQKAFRVFVYIASPLAAAFILSTDTKLLSYTGVPMIALGVVASAYVLVRILWTIRKPSAEQKLVLSGLGVLVLALAADTLYFNTATSSSMPGSMMETALILFSLLQMTALLHATMRETAEAKQAERRMTAENAAQARLIRLKNDMVAMVSHELRTPLTVMSSYAQYAVKSIQNGDFANESIQRLNTIPKEANRLADLSSTLLDVFKELDNERQKTPLSVSELIEHTTSVFKPIMDRKHNRQIINIESELPYVFGNEDELTQVFFNLLSNADTHTKNGTISTAAELAGGLVLVTIADTGEGISPELLPHVFEKHRHDENGTGYGLTICKEIIEEHGGEINIKSDQYRGTTVIFTLPVWGDQTNA
ncbi:MAG: HAMP domain-containing histidine kinase [Oscillospiraceae bacterium]|nr:HAMP domain-containing histidine kinase [Oscillospiraceae bacterium]